MRPFKRPASIASKHCHPRLLCWVQTQDMQEKFDLSKVYRDHINQVGADRALEDFVSVAWLSMTSKAMVSMCAGTVKYVLHQGHCLSGFACMKSKAQSPLAYEDALTFHVDGMDQSKWSVPRSRGNRVTKSQAPLLRPRFKVQGIWNLNCT